MRPESWEEWTRRERLPHEPVKWRRHMGRQARHEFAHFGYYSARSMAKWIKLRGHSYDVLLANGQLVIVGPKRNVH